MAAPPATSSRSIGSGSATGRGSGAAGAVTVAGPVEGTVRTGAPEAAFRGGAVVPLGGPLGALVAGAMSVAAGAMSAAAGAESAGPAVAVTGADSTGAASAGTGADSAVTVFPGAAFPALAGGAFLAGALVAVPAVLVADSTVLVGDSALLVAPTLSVAAAAAFFVAAAAFFTAVPSPAACSAEAAISSTAPVAVAAAFCAADSARSASPCASPAPSWAASLSANWPSSLLPTSVITPRPNWAGRPVMLRSVSTFTRVIAPSAARFAVMVAAAVPLPRWSLPRASMTAW